MAYPFKSEFSQNAKLKACAIRDSDHIGENFAPVGLWVELIQKALNAWVARVNQTLEPKIVFLPITGRFDSNTGDYVELFKTTENILNRAGKVDRIVGIKTVKALDDELAGKVNPSPAPAPEVPFVCGPDVTEQVAEVWTRIQTTFNGWNFVQKFNACNKIFLPIQMPGNPLDLFKSGFDLEGLKDKAKLFADINAFDTLPIYQGSSAWLRTPPVFDPATNGPCATPSSKVSYNPKNKSEAFDPAHESEEGCSNTVQVAGKCWLNGSVNYGTLGIMVKLCSDFALHPAFFIHPFKLFPSVAIYNLPWAIMLIKAYKTHGNNPEKAEVPIAWTKATFSGGPRGVPAIAGNRPKCKCSCNCKGDVVTWDFVWEPFKTRSAATDPKTAVIK